MMTTTRSLRRIACALVFCCGLSVAQSPSAQESLRLDRLLAVAKLWAATKYFHPYLAYRDDIDWDAALVKAIPKVNAANNGVDYSAAVAAMLSELGDPATRVLSTPAAPDNDSRARGTAVIISNDSRRNPGAHAHQLHRLSGLHGHD
jgi:hypothetical protein